MANNFFSRFPKIAYKIGDSEEVSLTNIVKNVDANDILASKSSYYTFYDIKDGERPDTVSYKIYESPEYHWTFFILNDRLRAGLNAAWPLSLNQLEHMIEREYDKYSVISFKPNDNDMNGLDTNGLVNLINLNNDYLPYLKLINPARSQKASILKYDDNLIQLFIHSIKNNDGTDVNSIKSFIESDYFQLSWDNPYEEGSEDYVQCNNLKSEFVLDNISLYAEFDPSTIIDPNIFIGLSTQVDIDAAIYDRQEQYVFNKIYEPVIQDSLKWISARDAASEYYIEEDGITKSISAYDVLVNDNTIFANYISNYEKESLLNDKKEKIRVVRKDRISDFVTAYFDTLNS